MLQVNDTMRLLNDFGAIGQHFCQDCLRAATESLSDPQTGLERAYREQLRATRTAVDGLLSLEHRCIEEWRSQLPEDERLSLAPRAVLDATDAAIGTRTGLWHAWFASAERMDPQSLMAPLMPLARGFPWTAGETPAAPTRPALQKKGGTPRPDTATAEATSERSAAE